MKFAHRVYKNLNPAAVRKVDRTQIGKLVSFLGQYRLQRGDALGQVLPNTKYVFVTSTNGEVLMHPRYRHPVIANGAPVLYAGEANFLHGHLQWWSNASGNYRPDRDHAVQAGLPMELFYTHEQIRIGFHKRPRKSGQISS